MPIAAPLILGAATVGSAVIQSNAASRASRAQVAAGEAAAAQQQQQADQARADLAPFREAGVSALNRLNTASTGDMSNFFTSPDYSFVRSEGQRDIGNSFSARGGAASGNALTALTRYNQGLASGQYTNWWDRQLGLAGIGFNGTSATTQSGQAAANNISDIRLSQGDARASGIVGGANAWGNALGGLAGIYGDWRNSPASLSGINRLRSSPSWRPR
jgi:type II secretory pathway pseudopilin PulG